MPKKAVYPGTFDPVTNGHIDLIKRASRIFAEVTVAVASSRDKKPLFSVEERIEMLKKVTKGLKNVEVGSFSGLAVDYVIRKKANVIVRGLRMISDFEYEFQMALTNRKLRPGVETIFLMPHENYSYLSSKLIKEACSLGADVKKFVPGFIARELRKRLGKRRKK